MRRFLPVICAMLLSAPVFGQQIRSREAGMDEFRTLLEATGYEAFSFDLTELLGARYDITTRIREYAAGQKVGGKEFHMGSNKVLLSDFPEDQHAQIIASGGMADSATQTFSRAEKLLVGFYPSGCDTLARVLFDIPGLGRSSAQLNLRGIELPATGKKLYSYRTRPFVIDKFEVGKPIPLVLLGSMWYDEKSGLCRFCGEREIAPDMSSEMMSSIPHYFVVEVEFTEKQ